MQATTAFTHPAPEPNTTPLIDVLLVLLVLLVLCLPMVTHQTTLTMPGTGPAQPSPVTRVEIDFDGQLFWNGAPVASNDQLNQMLRHVGQDEPRTLIQVVPDRRAPYERVAQVLAAAQRMHVTKLAVASVADGAP